MIELLYCVGFVTIVVMIVCVARSRPFEGDDEDRWGSL